MKNRWLAMLLNVLPLPVGLGYLYLGQPRRFLWTFLGAVAAFGVGFGLFVLIVSGQAACAYASSPCGAGDLELLFLVFVLPMLPWIILAAVTARNAWRLATPVWHPVCPDCGRGHVDQTALSWHRRAVHQAVTGHDTDADRIF